MDGVLHPIEVKMTANPSFRDTFPKTRSGPQGPVHRIRDRDGLFDCGVSGRRLCGAAPVAKRDRTVSRGGRRAGAAALAREGKQILVGAGVAADPGEAVLQEPAGEESVADRGDDGVPRAVGGGEPLVVHQDRAPRHPGPSELPAPHPRDPSAVRGAERATDAISRHQPDDPLRRLTGREGISYPCTQGRRSTQSFTQRTACPVLRDVNPLPNPPELLRMSQL